jgi:hypothetical protein
MSPADLRWLASCHLFLLVGLAITSTATDTFTFETQVQVAGAVGAILSLWVLIRPDLHVFMAATGAVCVYAVLRAAGFVFDDDADFSSFDAAAGRIGVLVIWAYIIARNAVPPARRHGR